MAARLIAYPFRIAPNGYVHVRDDAEENYYAGELANLLLTHPGERPFVPDYGVDDPTFDEFSPEAVAAKIDMFGPPVSVENVTMTYPRDGVLDIEVSFTPVESSLSDDEVDPDLEGEDEDMLTESSFITLESGISDLA